MAKQARQVPRVKVISRHGAKCERKSAGKVYIRCQCPKALYWYADGKEQVISADTNYQEAERKANEKQAGFERVASGEPEYLTVSGAVDLYIKSKTADGWTAKSVQELGSIVRRIVTFFSQRGIVYVKDIKRADLETWRTTWTGAASTKAKIQKRVKSFFKYAYDNEMIERNPASGLAAIKGARDMAPTVALNDAQFSEVLNAIDALTHREDVEVERIHALALLQRWSGLAIQDAVTIERTRFVAGEDGWVNLLLRRAKTGVEVFTALPPQVAEEILSITPVTARYLFWDGEAKHAQGNVSALPDRLSAGERDGEPQRRPR